MGEVLSGADEMDAAAASPAPAVRVALAGIAGYGDEYLASLLNDPRAAGIELVGVADPVPQRCRRLEPLHRRAVPIHPSLESLFASTGPIDLMMIATPIHLHARHTCFALRHGTNVLCEKPLAASVDDAVRMAECERAAGPDKFAAIGYQWCFSDAVQALKRDILRGELGRAVRLKSICFFPRAVSYFSRNDWAGRLRTSGGEHVLDSPANNATAHYLQNMLYLLGGTRETAAMPTTVQAELYRANDIENYDTAALRATLASGCELLFYTTHAVPERLGPRCHFEFEHAVVEYDFLESPRFVARFRNGEVRDYGDPGRDRTQKIWQSIDAVRTGAPVACGIRGATPHTVAVCAAQRSVPAIAAFPPSARHAHQINGETVICVDGLSDALNDCFARGILPAERGGLSWSHASRPVDCGELLDVAFPPQSRVAVTTSTPRAAGVYAS
jgi:predicted dehydrogenase